jgi:hypothetical protein
LSASLILWLIVVVMVAVAIVDDILLRRTLHPRPPRRDPVDALGDESVSEPDRAMFFGSNGNNERILGVLQSLYPSR